MKAITRTSSVSLLMLLKSKFMNMAWDIDDPNSFVYNFAYNAV